MKVFKDCFTQDELCSDSFKILPPFGDKSLEHVGFEVASKRVVVGAEDFGIADNSEEDGGSADQSETVIDIVNCFRLVPTTFTKKDFEIYIKKYMIRVKKRLQEQNLERVAIFTKGAETLIKKILADFDEFEFYMGEKMEPEAGIVFAYYKDEEISPRFLYIRDGLIEEKF